ncbi:hypothetical protein HF861_03170 [Faecalicoccus pleomorphus]|uniref:DNA-binding protein n=1 Tax=Faecalicoccus pleomorphus TaxID=1323 RepID=A0A7X9RI05_9FIRM|nr:hypothetical protein [Faecalicoccus pleomorphus]NME43882.1 hypothetical protein [Faecalicoccus pleomorphus]
MNLRMYTVEQVSKLFGCLPTDVEMLSEAGCLNPIQIGNKSMYSYEDIKNFQRNYTGLDVSTRAKAREAFMIVTRRRRKNE